jgi:hypothetical protein
MMRNCSYLQYANHLESLEKLVTKNFINTEQNNGQYM